MKVKTSFARKPLARRRERGWGEGVVSRLKWIAAFAGMTVVGFGVFYPPLRHAEQRNQGGSCRRGLSEGEARVPQPPDLMSSTG